ncbi:hypothetical protein QYF36_019838 [Acer negundo]|nr:hypothetical protein QYF36_019838 [Acer negundo]
MLISVTCLEHFCEAYRSYGKYWKKVTSQVCNRSVEMVEALYNMNWAFLSQPEGTASVVGLIAMMTDHYNVMEGSDSERESNDASVIPKKSQKRKRAECSPVPVRTPFNYDLVEMLLIVLIRINTLKVEALLNKSAMLCYTTEHHSVSAPCHDDGQVEANHNRWVCCPIDVDDNDVEHEAALTLTEGLQRIPQLEAAHSKLHDASVCEDCIDALQTLADLSLMFPDSTVESESSVQLKEDKALDMDDKFRAPEATYTIQVITETKLDS